MLFLFVFHPNMFRLLARCLTLPKGWIIDAMEILVVAFVLEDVAETFQLSSVQKGLIGSASFFGEPEGYVV